MTKRTPAIITQVLHDETLGSARGVIRSLREPDHNAFELDAQVYVNGATVEENTWPLTTNPRQINDCLIAAMKWCKRKVRLHQDD